MFRQWSFHGELKFLNWKLQNLNLSAAVVAFPLLEMPADNELSAILNRRCSSNCHHHHHQRLLQTKFPIRNWVLFLSFEFQKPDQWHSWQWGRGEAEICQGLIFWQLILCPGIFCCWFQYNIVSFSGVSLHRVYRVHEKGDQGFWDKVYIVSILTWLMIMKSTLCGIVWSCFQINWLEMSWMNWIGEKEGAGW